MSSDEPTEARVLAEMKRRKPIEYLEKIISVRQQLLQITRDDQLFRVTEADQLLLLS